MNFPKPNSSVHLNLDSYSIMMNFAQENSHKEIIGVFFGKINENGNGDIEISEAYPFRVGKRTE
ncbi:MAG: hypothetical protein ACTSVL_08365, partial [Promethearchaeota archaeon]